MAANVRVSAAVIFICSFAFSFSNATPSDIDCLRSLKDSVTDPFNYLSSWNFENQTEEGFICRFVGVDCWHNDENKVLNLGLSDMELHGMFPVGLEYCTSLSGLDLSRNKFYGPIPLRISRILSFVTFLDLSSNQFSGEIPPDLGNLRYVNVLRLDNNQLQGQIPSELGRLHRLKTFTVANNKLSGQVPQFSNVFVPVESYANNAGLCGGPLRSCPKDPWLDFFISGLVTGWSLSTLLVMLLCLLGNPSLILKNLIGKSKKRSRNGLVSDANVARDNDRLKIPELEKFVTKFSFAELAEATNNFSQDRVVGIGRRGTLYKAMLRNGWLLAIKRVCSNSELSIINEGFTSELMTLGRLRHNNLVPLIGFCFENEQKLIVYKHMANGNLYDWLHPKNDHQTKGMEIMDWSLRVKIAVGVAEGLAWLHHKCNFRVTHNKISSQSILLDQNFEPKISNFWEAKFLNLADPASSWSNLSFICLPSELGSAKRDVHCFGIVLLELVTRMEPQDLSDSLRSFPESNLVPASSSSSYLFDAVDESLVGKGFDEEILQILELAIECSGTVPDLRPSMLDVCGRLAALSSAGCSSSSDQSGISLQID